jgi:Tol biopolymer transport system component/DNA-binding winged helix-turn-helix (wHTH) protein
MEDRPGTSFRLGERWRVDPHLYRLTGPDGAVQVGPKVMGVLVELAREPGWVRSQEELREAVWGTPHVSDEVVRRAVYELRKILGERAGEARFIETIPRAGYRLVAPVSATDVESGPGATTPGSGAAVAGAGAALDPVVAATTAAAPAPGTHDRRLPRAAWLAAAATALAVVFSIVWVSGQRRLPAPPRIVPLTSYPGLEFDPALSPDGDRVAFIRSRPDGKETALWVKVVGSESLLRLADAVESPTWSPDGRYLAFVAKANGAPGEQNGEPRWEIRRVPALGGPVQPLAALGSRRPYGLAWSPDGASLALGWAESDGEPYSIVLLDPATGDRRRLTGPPPAISGDGEPAWSPDGTRIAFLRNVYPLIQDLYTVPAAGGPARRITASPRKIRDVEWSADGSKLLFTLYDAGDHRLWTVPAAGGEPAPAPVGAEGAMTLTRDAGRGRLAYSRYAFRFRLLRLDLASGESRPIPALSSTRLDGEASVSPEGGRLAFASTRSGSFEIWISGDDWSGARRLTDFGGPYTGQPSWSPGGEWIAFTSTAGGDADVWRVASRGGLPERLTSATSHEVAPWWSGDARWLYYSSDRTGSWELWRQPAAPAAGGERQAEQVTRGGGHRAAESPDRRWIYFDRRGEPGLWRLPAGGGRVEPVPIRLGPGQSGNWAVGPGGVYFVAKSPEHDSVLYLLDGGREARQVAVLEDWPMSHSLALAPGAPWLIYSQAHGVESDIVLVDGAF